MCQNIPGLDAPSWSRISGNDEQQEEEEEFKAEQIWNQQQQQQAQADKAVQVSEGDRSEGGKGEARMARADDGMLTSLAVMPV